MNISALASGSSGNCFFIENPKEKGKNSVLIDAGISCRQIVERLSLLGKNPEKIKAVFITHEHSDHTRGADVLARNFKIPIYSTEKTAENHILCKNNKLVKTMDNNETIKIAGMQIDAFQKSHKAADPVSYRIASNKKTASVITDLGFVCRNSASAIGDSDILCLESNHDEKMLEEGPYPYYLKKWIRSDIGHLSNTQAALSVLEHGQPKLKNIILSHLSQTNNTPQLALKSFESLIKERSDLKPKFVLSGRNAPTEMIKI